ncbi:MAG TPA: class I SAM-dependent methyltransferase [Solirubrobacterales bacterium]|nr:class I SAM-dependent methyltransferase [Solirubrobacterales bacterium]
MTSAGAGRRAAAEGAVSSRTAMRRAMFLSQDGVVLATTLKALDDIGVLDASLAGEAALPTLLPGLSRPAFGAIRVGLQCLASTGWLEGPPGLDPDGTRLRWTERGREAAAHRGHYVAVGAFLAGFPARGNGAWSEDWAPRQVAAFRALVDSAVARWGTAGTRADVGELVRAHLDGGLAVPTMLWLHESGRLGESGPDLPTGDAGTAAAYLLTALGWRNRDGAWTEAGRQAQAFALNFGGVATYLPLLARLPELFRGELTVEAEVGAPEWHVDRELNLRISALAHGRYFRDTDPIFVELFDRQPLAEQPRFIADMGCGEGSWLVHLHSIVRERTLRGAHLEDQPLTMVGVDPDPGALDAARRNLDAAGAQALLVSGDVTNPDDLARTLAGHGLAIEDGIHIRSFIDHERGYRGARDGTEVTGWATGAYLAPDGGPLSGDDVERDLVAHLRRWAPHVRRHGLVVLEAHCVAPPIASRHLGALHGVAFDAHQAYSKQYPVDFPVWVSSCRAAGLAAETHREKRYPASRPFVSITLNRLLAAGEDDKVLPASGGEGAGGTWKPGPGLDLEDGRALHRMLFAGGDIRYPAMWHSPPTGHVVGGALEVVEERLAAAGEGTTIRVLDYGAGTGTAAIELLKACRERRFEQRLARSGAALEVHLVDLPTGWFAQAHELLSDCAWVRFHSLAAPGGGFRPLPELLGEDAFDVAMASMVFHLIPPRGLERAADGLAAVLAPGGRLVWSAPDLGPPGPYAALLHDPNRALRERWLAHLGGRATAAPTAAVEQAVRAARESFDEAALRAAQERAERRIRPRPLASEVADALAGRFEGEVEMRSYEMLGEEIVRGLLVPSNGAEYLPEIPDRELRDRVITDLMTREVLPAMQEGPAGTALGLNLHWTLGVHRRR